MLADLEEAGDVVEEAEDEDWKDVEDDSPVPPEPGLERVADAAESLHTDGDSEVGGGEQSTAAESDHHIGHIGVPVIQLPRPEQDRNRPEKWGGKGWNYLVMQVKTTQRMKIMSTRARQTINLWNVSLKSFLLRIIMLTTFPAVNRANSHSSVNYVLPIIPNIPISGTKYPSMIRPSGPSEFCSTHQAYQC